jgi:hypothetical protein
MKISEILNYVNTFEKNYFLRNIDQIISEKPKNYKKIEKILTEIDGQIKNADNLSVEKVYKLVEAEYENFLRKEFSNAMSQLDILADILIRDGNCLMSREWLLKLYEKEIRNIKSKAKQLKLTLQEEEEDSRLRDYKIYKSCIEVAYKNDQIQNRDNKVTSDEQSILNELIKQLDLSHEEVKLINYSVVPLKKLEIDDLITYLVKSGIILYSKKHHEIFVPDEIVQSLRRIRGREVSDKVFRQVLKQLKDSQINLIARKHNIDWKQDRSIKIKEILHEGLSFSNVMLKSIHRDGTTKTEKKSVLNELIEKKLKIEEHIGGASLEDKFQNLLDYFNKKDQEDNISISIHGYDKLLTDLEKELKSFEKSIRQTFELQDKIKVNAENLLKYNLKPIDILNVPSTDEIKYFCEKMDISIRGNELLNILDRYKDAQGLFLENYINISNRDINELKANGLEVKEAELGVRYEELTKLIFENMGLNVDDNLKREINTAKDKMDIVIRLDKNEVIIIECKTKKDRKFNTYSSASRQIKAYKELVSKKGYKVSKTFIVAPDFSEDFINECGLDYDLNLSLITSTSLIEIYDAFQRSSLKEFPYKILLRDVLIDSKRVVKSITK